MPCTCALHLQAHALTCSDTCTRPRPNRIPAACSQIDDWMDNFDSKQERMAREKQAAMGEDGWTVVVRAKVRLGRSSCGRVAGLVAGRGGLSCEGAVLY